MSIPKANRRYDVPKKFDLCHQTRQLESKISMPLPTISLPKALGVPQNFFDTPNINAYSSSITNSSVMRIIAMGDDSAACSIQEFSPVILAICILAEFSSSLSSLASYSSATEIFFSLPRPVANLSPYLLSSTFFIARRKNFGGKFKTFGVGECIAPLSRRRIPMNPLPYFDLFIHKGIAEHIAGYTNQIFKN